MLPVRLQVQNSDTATRTHIHVRKVSREEYRRALISRAQTAIVLASVLVLGCASMAAVVRLHQVEQQLAAAAKV